MENNNKITLYVDVDDTVLNSSEAIVDILNKKYNISPPKTIEDVKDWGYRSIYKNLGNTEIEDIYGSDDFFDKVTFKEDFLEFYNLHKDKFSFVFVTKGNADNISKKKEFLDGVIKDGFEYVGMVFKHNADGETVYEYDKSHVDMVNGIQIDDRVDALKGTNAAVRILLKNGRENYWNKSEDCCGESNLYIVNSWNEIADILLFVSGNLFLLANC